MELSDLLKSAPAAGAAIVAVAGALYKAIKALLEFNDEYLRKRPFKRLSFLLNEAGEHHETKAFLTAIKHAEIFREAFGRSTSPRVAHAFMSLYETGHFSVQELQAGFLYSKLEPNGSLSIPPGKAGTITLWIAGIFIATMAVYSGVLAVSLLMVKSAAASLLALFVLLFFVLFAWFMGRDGRQVFLARAASKKLTRVD